MGMDVFGRAPDSEVGEYFRASVWSWHPLASYIEEVAPDLFAKCTYWHTNDGDGLDAEDSALLADRLALALTSGQTARYIERQKETLNALPDEPCRICGGTGKRPPPPAIGPGDRPCNACNGNSWVRPFETYYELSLDSVQRFQRFLQHCGGFSID